MNLIHSIFYINSIYEKGGLEMPLMKTYCAWCGKFLRLVKCATAQADSVSDGICETCFKNASKEIAEIQRPFRAPPKEPEHEK